MPTSFMTRHGRTVANYLGTKANEQHKKARECERQREWYADKAQLVRDFMANSPVIMFTVIYVILVVVDAFVMRPIINVVVSHGLQMEGPLMRNVFLLIYLFLAIALTVGFGYGFGKAFDGKLRDLQVELERVTANGKARAIIEEEVLADERRDRIVGAVFGSLLLVLLLLLSAFRIYLTNNFEIKLDSPDDWFSLLLPLALGAALCFFGIYKDVLVRSLLFERNRDKFEAKRDDHVESYSKYARQAKEQDEEAIAAQEETEKSADLIKLLYRYNNQSVSDPGFYDELKEISVELMYKGQPVVGLQVAGITGDGLSINTVTNSDGKAMLLWTSDSDFLKVLRIGEKNLPGARWLNRSQVKLDMANLMGQNSMQDAVERLARHRLNGSEAQPIEELKKTE